MYFIFVVAFDFMIVCVLQFDFIILLDMDEDEVFYCNSLDGGMGIKRACLSYIILILTHSPTLKFCF